MKNTKNEFVQRIPSHYVGKDCIQVMIPHMGDTISILDADGVIYRKGYNKYLTDPRRKQFPYAEIPVHMDFVKGKKVEFINQIYDFDKVYIIIADDMIRENYVIRDGDEAILFTKCLNPVEERPQVLSRNELEKLVRIDPTSVFNLQGQELLFDHILSDEEITDWYRKELIRKRKNELVYGEDNNTYKELTDYFYKSVNKLTIEDVPSGLTYTEGQILITTTDDKEATSIKQAKKFQSIKMLHVDFLGPDSFLVQLDNYPITIYNIAHARQLDCTNRKNTPEPKFSRLLNKNIDYEEVNRNKKLILSLKNNNYS